MSFHTQPTGKGGSGDRLSPVVVQYDDVVRIIDAGYGDFGASASHCVGVVPIPETIGPDNLVTQFVMTETPAGTYTLDAPTLAGAPFFTLNGFGGSLGALPGTTVFKNVVGVGELLRISSGIFPAEDAWYLVGVFELPTPGVLTTIGSCIDFQIVYVQKQALEIISSSAPAGIDVDTLDRALALAGHNVRVRNSTFVDGLVATREVVGADRDLDALTTTELEDPDSDVGSGLLVRQRFTLTPDSVRNPSADLSGDF